LGPDTPTHPTAPNTLADLTVDVYAFLVIFLKKHPQYASAPFHLAAESWGGHYGPHIASYIHEKNQEFIYYPGKDAFYINLSSLIIANGLTEPYSQFDAIPDHKCGGAPYPFLKPNGVECRALRMNRPICLRLISACYGSKTKAACAAATAHCWPTMMVGDLSEPIFCGVSMIRKLTSVRDTNSRKRESVRHTTALQGGHQNMLQRS